MAAKKRIYEVAREFQISSEALMKILRELRFEPKSHMSVATDEMVAAIKRKFDIEKANAKKDLEQRKKQDQMRARTEALKRKHSPAPQSAPASTTTPSAPGDQYLEIEEEIVGKGPIERTEQISKKPRPTGPQAGGGPSAGPQQGPGGKRRRGDRKKKPRQVDQSEVSKSFRSTIAAMSGPKRPKKYRRRGAADGEEIEVEKIVDVTEFMTVGEVAKTLGVKPAEVIGKLFHMGQMATINQRLDIDTIEMICLEYGTGIEQQTEVGEVAKEEEKEKDLTKRPPVVTVMGHVDHGKTSLLDYIRKTDVVSGESGAITQHIGAYQIQLPDGERITFLDTPGHEAFTAMRARGAQVTDVVILVVAADDGVMPQTIEAIDHAKAAKAPIIVAINKIDKPEASPDKIKQELSGHGLLSEDWGGDVVMVPVSAKTGKGIDKLLEMVVLTADMLELRADPTIRAQGAVVEAKLEKGHGAVATVLITTGTVSVGDSMVAGACSGRVRSIMDDHGINLKTIGPGTPGQLSGLDGVPQAGDSFLVTVDDAEAREISLKRSQIKREIDHRRPRGHMSLESVFEKIQEGQIKELPVLIKGDVDGSVEAISDKLTSIEHSEVRVRIVHRGVGAITESDVLLASTSDAIIIGFHVGIQPRAREIASREKVEIRQYDIIYDVVKEITDALEGLLAPTTQEKPLGEIEVRETFRTPKIGVIAGCYVREGMVKRDSLVNLMRDGRKIYSGGIDSLRRFKDDVREVQQGYECGIHIQNYNDVKVGDIIEAYEMVTVQRKLQLK